jgi:DNA-binding beta-propeller fold protein YncE/mono/diheme cytochrome c family protein
VQGLVDPEAARTAAHGSTVALAKVGTKSVAFIADEDARAIDAFDLETQKELAATPVDGAPSQIMVAPDGRIFALLRDRSRLQVLEAEKTDGSLIARCSVETAAEPVGLASTPDDKTIVVSSAWGRALTAYESERLARLYEVSLPREPRAVVVSDDGATAFVSHAVGSVISAVDLSKPAHPTKAIDVAGTDGRFGSVLRLRKKQLSQLKDKSQIEQFERMFASQRHMGCQGFALAKSVAPGGRILAPQVFVDSGRLETRPEGYGNGQIATEEPGIAVIDEGSAEAVATSLQSQRGLDWRGDKSARDHREACLLPRAAATDPRTRTLLVACFGIDNVIGYDAASANPEPSERRRWTVGTGPSGIAVDPELPRAVVWSQFDRSVSVLALGGSDLMDDKAQPPGRVVRVALSPGVNGLPADVSLGRVVFHTGGDTRISKDGRACASCHPDGRDDAITWATPEGPRRSIMLAGRVTKAKSFSWNGTTKTLRDHLGNTFDRLEGTGLRGVELEGLVAYLSAIRAPVPEQDARPSDPKVLRGAQVFASSETACASCHNGPTFSDGQVHDVKSKAAGDRGDSFRTPSLHFIGGTGPYFHDGRYKSLHDLLRDVDGKMGHTKQLSDKDLDALEAYLRTL